MKTNFRNWIILGLLFLILSGFSKAPPTPAAFQSAWLTIGPGEMITVPHDLAKQPAFYSVMVKQLVLNAEGREVETIRPHTELSDHPLIIHNISPKALDLYNASDQVYLVQINLK